MELLLPHSTHKKLLRALERAGTRESGGILLGEHVGPERFRVVDLTVQTDGSFARFVRALIAAAAALRDFFARTSHDYRRFNYLGEWHSHPSFSTEPSQQDRRSMQEIVDDREVGANFAVLLIVRLGAAGSLDHSVNVFVPGAPSFAGHLTFEREGD